MVWFQERPMVSGKLRFASRFTAAGVLALALAACAVYEPAPAYPTYGYYAPGYYYAPPPSTSFSFGYSSGGRPHHHHHRHRHWRG
jgi:hypothetical protein